jgi:predicted HicB family RNase H-like nuclease
MVSPKKSPKNAAPREKKWRENPDAQFHMRFADEEHRALVVKAQEASGFPSLNSWFVHISRIAAKRQLGIGDPE